MKAMILAAGLGTRMRPLTQKLPKPLVRVAGSTLIEHCITELKESEIKDIVINLGYRGEMIRAYLGDGSQYGVKISYTLEDPNQLLGSGGAVKNALSELGAEPFILCSADIWTNYPLCSLANQVRHRHNFLLVVDNPVNNPEGDFLLSDQGEISVPSSKKNVTFAGIGVFCPSYFAEIKMHRFGLMSAIQQSIQEGRCSGRKITSGIYANVGTPQERESLETLLGNMTTKVQAK